MERSGGGAEPEAGAALAACSGLRARFGERPVTRPAVPAGRGQRDLRGGVQGGVEGEGGGHQEHRERRREERLPGGGTVIAAPPPHGPAAHMRARSHPRGHAPKQRKLLFFPSENI